MNVLDNADDLLGLRWISAEEHLRVVIRAPDHDLSALGVGPFQTGSNCVALGR